MINKGDNIKTILMVHGDKGGVGKYTFASLAADYVLQNFGKVAVVEGDAVVGDVGPRFINCENASVIHVDLARSDMSEDAVVRLFTLIEQNADMADHIIINTPASASKTLDGQADLIKPAIEALVYKLIVAWLIDIGDESAILSAKSELCKLADIKVAVRSERIKESKLLLWEKRQERKDWLKTSGIEVVVPAPSERVIEKTRISNTYSEIILDTKLSIIERVAIKRWVEKSWPDGVMPIYAYAVHYEYRI
jgi:hypothetical protein